MAGSSQSQQPSMDRSVSLDRGISFQEDKTAMTIDFLRARLLAARSDSKAARQEVQMMATKVLELEQQIDSEIQHRKKLETARLDALSAYMDKLVPECEHLFQESTRPSQVIDGMESALNKDMGDRNDEGIESTEKDKGTLTWVRRNGAKRLPSLFRFGNHKVIASLGVEGESSHKRWAGKSVRHKKDNRAQAADPEEDNEKVQSPDMDVDGEGDHFHCNIKKEEANVEGCLDDHIETAEQFEKEKGMVMVIRDGESMVDQFMEESGIPSAAKERSVSIGHVEDAIFTIDVNKACAPDLHHEGLCQEDTDRTFLGVDESCENDDKDTVIMAAEELSLRTQKDGHMLERLMSSEQLQKPSSGDGYYEELDLRPANNMHGLYNLTDSYDSIARASEHRRRPEAQCSNIFPPYARLHAAGPQYAVNFNASSIAPFPGWGYAAGPDVTSRHHRHTSIDASLDKVMGVLRVLEVAKQEVVEGSIGPATTPFGYYHPHWTTKTPSAHVHSSLFGRALPHINDARLEATGFSRSSSMRGSANLH